MMRPHRLLVGVTLALALAQVGCLGEIGSPDDEADLIEMGYTLDNGFVVSNGFNLPNGASLVNGIKLTNGVNLANGLDTVNGIKLTNGIIAPPTGSGLEQWIDADPTHRLRALRYLIECALAPEDTVEVAYRGTSASYAGKAGLAPGWASGLMSVPEQEKVTGCLLARVNAAGLTIRIDMFGPMPGFDVATADELTLFSHQEGAFFGNLFAATPLAFACALGGTLEKHEFRACSGTNCGIVRPLTATNKIEVYEDGALGYQIVTYLKNCFGAQVCEPAALGSGYSYARSCLYGARWDYPMTTHLSLAPPGAECYGDYGCSEGLVCESGVCR